MTLFFKVILANYRLSELSKGPSGAKPVSLACQSSALIRKKISLRISELLLFTSTVLVLLFNSHSWITVM